MTASTRNDTNDFKDKQSTTTTTPPSSIEEVFADFDDNASGVETKVASEISFDTPVGQEIW